MRRIHEPCGRGNFTSAIRLDQFSLNCIHDGFEAVMGAQFLIDVVKMVAQGLQADIERFCDLGLVLAFRE